VRTCFQDENVKGLTTTIVVTCHFFFTTEPLLVTTDCNRISTDRKTGTKTSHAGIKI